MSKMAKNSLVEHKYKTTGYMWGEITAIVISDGNSDSIVVIKEDSLM
jgi:hypothetical protein